MLILYSMMEPRLRLMVYTVRKWADIKKLTGERGFTKCALTMLVVFFHQRVSVLPTPLQIKTYMEQYARDTCRDKSRTDFTFNFDHPPRVLQQMGQILPRLDINQKNPSTLSVDFRFSPSS